jgi:hypothetical protein
VKVTRNGKIFEIAGNDALQQQTISNAPNVDDTSFSGAALNQYGVESPDHKPGFTAGVMVPSTINGKLSLTIQIANDLTAYKSPSGQVLVSSTELKQRTYVHELGNYLSGLIAGGDGYYFGRKGGVPHALDNTLDPDFDTGANLESCVFGSQKP